MALTDFTIPNLYNGVSQQPITIRLPNQLDEQINGYSSISNGLTKRKGSYKVLTYRLLNPNLADPDPIGDAIFNQEAFTYIKTLEGVHYSGVKFTYQIIVSTYFGHLWVKHLSGPNMGQMRFVGTFDYLKGQRKHFKTVIDGNKLYILNRSKTVIGSDDYDGSTELQGALIHVANGTFSNDYIVNVELFNTDKSKSFGSFTAKTTIGNSGTEDVTHLKSSWIAEDLRTKLKTARDALVATNPELSLINLETSAHPTDQNYLHLQLVATQNSGWSQIAFDGTTYVMISSDTKKEFTMAKSTDGTNWTDLNPVGVKKQWRCIIRASNNKFYAGAADGTLASSTDGTTWSTISYSTNQGGFYKFVESNGRLFAITEYNRSGNYTLRFDPRLGGRLWYLTLTTETSSYVDAPIRYPSGSTPEYFHKFIEDICIDNLGRLQLAYVAGIDGFSQVIRFVRVTLDSSLAWTVRSDFWVNTYGASGITIQSTRTYFGFDKLINAIGPHDNSLGTMFLLGNKGAIYYEGIANASTGVGMSMVNTGQVLYSILSPSMVSTSNGKIITLTSKTSFTLSGTYDSDNIKQVFANGSDRFLLGNLSLYKATESTIRTSNFWTKNSFGVTVPYVIECKAWTTNTKNSIYAFNGSVKDITTLPNGPDGYTIKVDSDTTSDKENYYLAYDDIKGYWAETTKKGLTSNIDPLTMPLVIEDASLDPDTNIDFIKRLEVKPRESGDEISNPLPSFVGKKINDIYLFNNRFGLVAGSNVVLSRIDDYNTFMRTSNALVLGADRIDLKASLPSSRGTDLAFAVPYDSELVISSGTSQYSLKSNTAFDPKTASLSTTTEFQVNTECDPVNAGNSIYLTLNRNYSSGVLELARRSDVGIAGTEMTLHIPTYIEGKIIEMVSSTTENILIARTDRHPKRLYIQNRNIRDGQLVQNAWHKWEYPEIILGIDIIGTNVYVTSTPEYFDEEIGSRRDVNVCSIAISSTSIPDSTNVKLITFSPHLDKTTVVQAFGQLTFDYNSYYYVNYYSKDEIVAMDNKGRIFKGFDKINEVLMDLDYWNTEFPDVTKRQLYVGILFEHSFTFSEQVVASYNNGEKTVNKHAKLLLRDMKISFENTGKFSVIVSPKGRDSFTQDFSGMILGDESATLGRVNISTGDFKFYIGCMSNSVKIKVLSNNPFPTSFNTAEWRGTVTTNSGR